MRKFLALPPLCLGCILAFALQSFGESAPLPMNSHPIAPTNFTFGCVSYTSCGDDGSWINTTSQPGTTRLWDSGTDWDILETAANTYKWTNLDTWLDLIAEHQPRAAIYTFGHVPCALASVSCSSTGTAGGGSTTSGIYWSPSPPKDLTASGSASFNAFVTELVQHCSPAGNCVKDYIKYFEMWNEPNLYHYWSGSIPQLYNMFKPAIAIIRKNIPGVIISTPPVSGGDTDWIASWMALENANGKLSDYFGFHSYLWNYTPEVRIRMIERMVAQKNASGWTSTPWMNTETNFIVATDTCSTEYTVEDCHGQLVRWHVLQYAYQGGAGGAVNVAWYDWPSISSGGYDTYYYTMMQWLTGSTFTASCAAVGNVYSCPLTESNGAKALIVWNPTGTSDYTPASGFIDYKEFNDTYGGATVTISNGESTKIGVIPIMFETAK